MAGGVRVRTLVVLVALVPLLVLTGLSAVVVRGQIDTAVAAATLGDEAERLGTLYGLRVFVRQEASQSQGLAEMRRLGVTPEMLEGVLGHDVVELLARTQQSVDAALAAIDTPGSVRAPLDRARADVDEPRTRYDEVVVAVDALIVDCDQRLRDARRAAKLDDELVGVLDVVALASAEFDAGSALYETYAGMMKPDAESPVTVTELARVRGAYDGVRRQLTAALTSLGYADLVDRLESAQTTSYLTWIDRIIAGEQLPPATLAASPEGRAAATGSVELADLVAELLTALVDDVQQQATAAQADARRSATNLIVIVVAAWLASVAVVTVVTRRVTSPLARLVDGSAEVTAGRLDAEIAVDSGPREVRAVSRSIAELTAAVRLLHRSADALADGSLDDGSLDDLAGHAPASGRLGELALDSASRLANSVADRMAREHELIERARRDALTGVVNRSGVDSVLDDVVGGPTGSRAAVAFVDLDDFKSVNDTLGHVAGDDVLKLVAQRLTDAVREGDVVGRYGGDEFVIVLHDVESAAAAEAVGRRIVATLAEPFATSLGVARVGASVGIAMVGEHDAVGSVLEAADRAAYEVKRAGKNDVRVAG
jgi:diguanylate cyclase (GGDEF)-like protein